MKKKNWNREELMKLSGSLWQSCTLQTAVQLDIFTTLSSAPLSKEDAAEILDIPVNGIGKLLNALTAMQLLEKNENLFSLTGGSRESLSKDSPQYIGHIICHHQQLSQTWSRLNEAIITGKPFRTGVDQMEEGYVEYFLKGMHTMASLNAPAMIKFVDLSDNRMLLDLGGGPGTYAIQFCRHNSNLDAVVFDMERSRAIAEANIKEHGYAERIKFAGGDFNSAPLPDNYDAAWLSHILHGEGEKACQALINKVADGLKTGGKIIIHEFILDEDETSPLFPALFSLNMFLHTDKGKSYTESQLTAMLKNANIENINRINLKTPSESGILWGKKKG